MSKPSRTPAQLIHRFYGQYPDLQEGQQILARDIDVRVYAAGEILFQRGSPVTHLYCLLTGRVEEEGLNRTGKRAYPYLERAVYPIKLLGLYDFLYHQAHSTHAIVSDASEILAIDVKSFEKLLYYYPGLLASLAPLALIERLRTIPLLSSLSPVELCYLAEAAQPYQYSAGAPIYGQAEVDAVSSDAPLYLIDQGQVQVTGPNRLITLLGNGAAFGIQPQDRSAQAVTDVSLFVIPQRDIKKIPVQNPEADLLLAVLRLRAKVETTLRRFFPAINAKLLSGFINHYYLPERYLLLRQGEMTDSMWLLMQGGRAQLNALDEAGNTMPTTMAEGPLDFCEGALFAQLSVDSTIEADAQSQWLRLHRLDCQAFIRAHGYHLTDLLPAQSIPLPIVGDEVSLRYPWLQDGEGIIMLRHRHWFILLVRTWLSLLLFALATVGLIALFWSANTPTWPIPLLVSAILVALFFFAWQVIDYQNDYLVVTNRRVVRQEKVLLQRVQLRETGLEQIQNVDVTKHFLGVLFGYGILKIQTAGKERGTISFDYIPDAQTVKQAIDTQTAKRRRYRQAASKLEIQMNLEGRLGLGLDLPERVWLKTARPIFAIRWWRRAIDFFMKRKERRKARYQQERVVWRKHWLILLQRSWIPALLLLLALTLLALSLFSNGLMPALPSLNLVLALFGLLAFAILAWVYTDWHNDTYEVTRDEVADVEKRPFFFDEKRRTARLLDIDNIKSEVPSTLHYVFNFGFVQLETAAVEGEFIFNSVPDPSGVVAEIRRRIEDCRRREEDERARQRAQELTDWFEVYNRLDRERQSAEG
jgi:CRP-like cAMP-binding protein/uncharacterized membrane protein YdbT with pleckstrin-like domain